MGQGEPRLGGPLGPVELREILQFEPSAASHRLGWVGLAAVRCRAEPPSELHPPAIPHHRLILVTRPPEELDLRFEGITTGFLGSAGQIRIVRNMIEDFRDKRTKVVIDPVMGDDGKLYGTYTAELCQSMKQLVPYADILLPNVTEACLLTDTPFFLSGHQDDYFQMADCLHRMGAKKVVITGIDMDQWIGNVVLEPGSKPHIIKKKRIGGTRSGTGDLFQAMITGETIQGRSLPEAVKRTAEFIVKCMAVTEELKIPDTDGVCFELLL